MDLVCQGIILIDMFPQEIGRRLTEVTAFLPTAGGAPANVAVAAARLGMTTGFIGKVGDDAFGHLLADNLKGNSVDISGLLFDKKVRTTLVFIAMPDEHSAEFVFYRNPGADLCIKPDEVNEEMLASTKAFHCDSLSLVGEPGKSAHYRSVELARNSGALISFDVNYRPTLWNSPLEAVAAIEEMLDLTDLLKINEIELELLTGCRDPHTSVPQVLERGPKLVAVTLGASGSYFCSKTGNGYIPPYRVKTVDAIGCGDAFIAGLLTRLITDNVRLDKAEDSYLIRAFQYANAVGALTALMKGVIPALPTAGQVEDFLLNHPD